MSVCVEDCTDQKNYFLWLWFPKEYHTPDEVIIMKMNGVAVRTGDKDKVRVVCVCVCICMYVYSSENIHPILSIIPSPQLSH